MRGTDLNCFECFTWLAYGGSEARPEDFTSRQSLLSGQETAADEAGSKSKDGAQQLCCRK